MAASPALLRKFYVLMNRVTENLDERDEGEPFAYFDTAHAVPWFERWIKIRAELMATETEFDDLPTCTVPQPRHEPAGADFEGRGHIDRGHVWRMWETMKDVADTLNHPSRQVAQVSFTREGVFLGGQPFDAMMAVRSILGAAKASITLVDNWVSEDTLHLIAAKADAVAAEILSQNLKPSAGAFVAAAKLFNSQYGGGPPLEVRTTSAFHDRFIVIDDTDCFHFGASIKDAAKKNAFMFSKIEEPAFVALVKATVAKEWAAATPVAL